MRITAEAARRFLVVRHFLAPARSLEGGPGAVLEVFRKLGSIQFDPLAVAGRSHDLVLHARVADYEPGWCDVLYERREIFEAYNKGLSLVPSSEFAWFRATLSRNAPRVLAENAEVAERVLERIRAEGPLSALDFERERGATTDWFGMPTNAVRAVLEAYAVTGVLGLARRDGNRRYYDLLERLLPADLLARDLQLREQLRHKLLSRYRAHGLLGGGGGGDISAASAPRSRARSTRDGTRCARSWSSSASSFPSRSRACAANASSSARTSRCWKRRRSRPPSVAFLPPFDPLVWDRGLLRRLFDFEYVWELFLPPAKRRWGWYVLPISFRDRFVGRIEPAQRDVCDAMNVASCAPRSRWTTMSRH